MANGQQEAVGGRRWLWWVLGLIALLLVVVWIFQSANDTPGLPATGETDENGTPIENIGPTSVEAIVQDPTQFDGKTVTVEGAVGSTYGSRILLLTEEGAVGGQGIIVASPSALTAREGETVTVTGPVRVGVVRDVLQRFGVPADGTDSIVGQRAVIVADTITSETSPAPQRPGGAATTTPGATTSTTTPQ